MYSYDKKIEKIYKLILEEENEVYSYNKNRKRLVNDVLNNKDNFCIFINRFIPIYPQLVSEEIERVYIDIGIDNFKEPDYIYKTNNGKVYYILEHQTIVDKEIVKRMLRYTISILKEEAENSRRR